MQIIHYELIILINKENKVLFLHRRNKNIFKAPGHWGLVGGKIEQGEKPIECAIREAHEEVGIILKQEDLTFVNVAWEKVTATPPNQTAITETLIACTFVARTWQGIPINKEPEQHDAMEWFALDVPPDPIWPIHGQILKAWQNLEFNIYDINFFLFSSSFTLATTMFANTNAVLCDSL